MIEAVQTIAEARGVGMAQVALAWLLDRPGVSSVILGARTVEQLQENLAAAGLRLDDDEYARSTRPATRSPPTIRTGPRGRAARPVAATAAPPVIPGRA